MIALLGPSGSGKTTLLDSLARRFRTGSITGSVLIDGEEFSNDRLRTISSYVEQEDALIGYPAPHLHMRISVDLLT